MRLEASARQSDEILSYLRVRGERVTFGGTEESYFIVTKDRQAKGELVGITDANSMDRKPRQVSARWEMFRHLAEESILSRTS